MTYSYRDDPMLGSVLAYWVRKRGTRPMPCRRDIDPTEISRELLPNLQIVEVVDGGARFRYRLAGTALVEAYGEEFTGKYSDELFCGERLRFMHEMYRAVCASKAPLFARNKYKTPRNIEFAAYRIYMPLSDDGGDVHHIFGVLRLELGVHLDSGIWGDGVNLDSGEQYVEPIAAIVG
jgi:hypothetical protein